MSTTEYVDAAARQLPTVWADRPDIVRKFWHQAGGGCMVLQRTLDEVTGAHIVLSEDVYLAITVYSDDGERCEGHEIVATDSVRNAVWWLLNGGTYPGPCPCLVDAALDILSDRCA